MTTHQNPLVGFRNESTAMTAAQVEAAQRACSEQVHEDFGIAWHTGCRMNYDAPRDGEWQIIFKDDSDSPGALGYHFTQPDGTPAAYVFARTCRNYGVSPSSVASHELLEMLGDPFIDVTVQVNSTTFYAYEACDPVEQSGYNKTVTLADGSIEIVEVSDFVTPAWFSSNEPGPYDFLQKVLVRRQLEPGGSYIGQFVCGHGWSQKNADGSTTEALDPDDVRRCKRPFDRGAKYLLGL